MKVPDNTTYFLNAIELSILFIAIFLLIATACSNRTKLDSDDFGKAEKRIEVLKKEIKFPSEVKDTEFELFNVNGFHDSWGSVLPGPSSLSYKFAVKVDTADISRWRQGLVKSDSLRYGDMWTREIVMNRKQNWLMNSQPKYYIAKGLPGGWSTTVVEYYPEGTIFKWVITN